MRQKLLESTSPSRAYYLGTWYDMTSTTTTTTRRSTASSSCCVPRARRPSPRLPCGPVCSRSRGRRRVRARARAAGRAFWTSLTAWRVASGALALAAVVLAVVAVTRDGGSPAVNGQRIALTSLERVPGDGLRRLPGLGRHPPASACASTGSRQLEGSQVYELWIAKDRKHRVSIGIFRPDAQGSIDTTRLDPEPRAALARALADARAGQRPARLVARLGRRRPPRLTRISAGARCRPRSGSRTSRGRRARLATSARAASMAAARAAAGAELHLADRRDPLGGGVGVERRRDGAKRTCSVSVEARVGGEHRAPRAVGMAAGREDADTAGPERRDDRVEARLQRDRRDPRGSRAARAARSGRSTRAISSSAAYGSNQWNAWPTKTASNDASPSGICSAVPS